MHTFTLTAATRALAIVAHPDDETIWMGGTLLRHPHAQWTICSLCRASDADRAPKFRRVCERFNARAVMLDLDDEGRLTLAESVPEITRLLAASFGNEPFDVAFTHGANGEYGHERHVGAHRAVTQMVHAGTLRVRELWYFHYQLAAEHTLAPDENADVTVALDEATFAEKKRVMTALYGFSPDGIDANYCTNPEAFKRHTNLAT